MRIHAWQVFQSRPVGWDFIDREIHPLSFALVEQEVLISHALVSWRYLDHLGETYKVYGLSAVLTYPEFQRRGYGQQVVKAATRHILDSDGDLALLRCQPHLYDFYRASGWIQSEAIQVRHGLRESPTTGGRIMSLFISERGKQGRPAFEREPLYVGNYMW